MAGGGLLSHCPVSHCPQATRCTQTIHLRGLNISFAMSKRSVNIFLQCKCLRIWFLAENVVSLQCMWDALRVKAAAQHSSSELGSAFTLHFTCIVNRWSSESHQACLNGRVATEIDVVNHERHGGRRPPDVVGRKSNTMKNTIWKYERILS